jgi:hypothetical protein
MDNDKGNSDRKSHFVLKRLKSGHIPFCHNAKLSCPFYDRVFQKNIDNMIQHATGVGKGSEWKHKPASKAKHALAVGPHVLF